MWGAVAECQSGCSLRKHLVVIGIWHAVADFFAVESFDAFNTGVEIHAFLVGYAILGSEQTPGFSLGRIGNPE